MAEHSDNLLTTQEAAAYLGRSEMRFVPRRFRPEPIEGNSRLYHKSTLEACLELMARDATRRMTRRAATHE